MRIERNATEGAADASHGQSSRVTAGKGISLAGVSKRFGRVAAVDDVSLEIEEGEFFVVLGPSGCGKSTLLRLIAGLETADAGQISVGGQKVAGAKAHVPPEARNVAVVFQSYALWPHMSVRKNVAFPVEAAGVPRHEAVALVDSALKAVALEDLASRKPAALSGGQQQRVALARCLAARASTVLMDEPLANLDVHLRAAMEDELARVHAASGATVLYITHDQREAMALATRVGVMQSGRLLQVAPPQTLYDRPTSEAVANFIGRSTICDAVVERVEKGSALVRIGPQAFTARCTAETALGAARVMIRPRDVKLGGAGPFAAQAVRASYRGGVFDLAIEADGLPLVAAQSDTALSPPLRFGFSGGWVLPGA